MKALLDCQVLRLLPPVPIATFVASIAIQARTVANGSEIAAPK